MRRNMYLIEIDKNIRKEKKTIDKLFSNQVINKDPIVRKNLIDRINNFYPTGYRELDKTLEEYQFLLQSDLINKLKI